MSSQQFYFSSSFNHLKIFIFYHRQFFLYLVYIISIIILYGRVFDRYSVDLGEFGDFQKHVVH